MLNSPHQLTVVDYRHLIICGHFGDTIDDYSPFGRGRVSRQSYGIGAKIKCTCILTYDK